jgi:hypothetical protein
MTTLSIVPACLMTNIDLIAAVRTFDAESTKRRWAATTKRGMAAADAEYALRCRALLPRLADALEAAEQVIAMIADTVIIRVVTIGGEQQVDYGCGICQGPWHSATDTCDHAQWCPRHV